MTWIMANKPIRVIRGKDRVKGLGREVQVIQQQAHESKKM